MAHNRLSAPQTYQLLKWLDTEEMRARALQETDEVMAAAASKENGFVVTPSNIAGARTTLNLKKRAEPAPAQTQDLTALEELLAEQAGRISALEHNTQALLDRVKTLEVKTQRIR